MPVRYGMVHGRFQPFHRGHLHYTLAAFKRSEHLIVGITNPDPSVICEEGADPDRHRSEANPFTFFERQWMIRAALAEASVDLKRVSIVPFPIHHPERWGYYCPKETLQFIRVFSKWENEKVFRFQQARWPVEVLDAGATKGASGSQVRRCLAQGAGWEDLVPPGVASVLLAIDASERLQRLTQLATDSARKAPGSP